MCRGEGDLAQRSRYICRHSVATVNVSLQSEVKGPEHVD
jgi:hypothetical protein